MLLNIHGNGGFCERYSKLFPLLKDKCINGHDETLHCFISFQYTTADESEDWIVLEDYEIGGSGGSGLTLLEGYDISGSGLINVVPPVEMAKVKITPILPMDEADEFFHFVVDFYACQHRK